MPSLLGLEMRSDKTIVVLNGVPWLVDFRRGRLTKLDAELARHRPALDRAFGEFDWLSSLMEWLRLVKYVDYSDEKSAEEDDRKKNLERHESGRQPDTRICYGQQFSRINLGHLDWHVPTDLVACAMILHFSFRAIHSRRFLSDAVPLKCNPSVGARHGIDVVVARSGIEFYYDCVDHSLVRLGSAPETLRKSTAFLLLLRPEVYSWRYPQSSVMFDVYLDIGHAIGNLRATSETLGMELGILDDMIFPKHESLRGLTPLLALRLSSRDRPNVA
jgi:hypothetical protein